jgi:hypothetical protein
MPVLAEAQARNPDVAFLQSRADAKCAVAGMHTGAGANHLPAGSTGGALT